MKERKSILEESIKSLTLYSIIFFALIFSVGIFVIKSSYTEEVNSLEQEYNEQINLSSNKYIKEELKNIKKYLDAEFSYLDDSAKEFVDSAYNFALNYLNTHEDKQKALEFLKANMGYPIDIDVFDGIDPTYYYYARYVELDNKKILRVTLNPKKYEETQRVVALNNIKNLHNAQLSYFNAKRLDDNFNFLGNERWYCVYENEAYTCYDKNWWLALEFTVKSDVLKEALEEVKSKRFESALIQGAFLGCSILIGFLGILVYIIRKKKEVRAQIELATKHFDVALNKHISNFNKNKQLNSDFAFKEFRTLSYALLRFIRQIQAKDGNIKKQAYIDNITGLMNMISVTESLDNYVKKDNKVLLFLFFNIDNFRIYNSMYGRSFGDEVLKIVAYRLYTTLKGMATGDNEHFESLDFIKYDKYKFIQNKTTFECLARVSADEFLLVIEVDKNEDYFTLAKKYHQKLTARSIKINSNDDLIEYEPFKINARVGFSIYPKDSKNLHECIGNADLAIENDKASGDNWIFGYTAEIGKQNEANLKLQQDIRNGIVNKEFLLYYQPKVDVKSGKIIGAEALVRWQKGDKLIFPDQFIGICERSNLIITLGNEIIKMACEAQRRWLEKGLELKLSINLSTKQLLSEGIVHTIEKNIQGIPPRLIEFEITESFSIENATSKAIIDKIKKLNVGLSMDDFGKGYSSLSYLNDQDLDFDVVKIDKCFIQNIDTNEKNRRLVEFIVNVIKSLNKRSVAEGVENIEILNFLKHLGCDEYQGYYFSRPVPENILLEKVYENGKD
ncbi:MULTISPECIES: bifunctional diguanylate cyclase/phosphodiesterase [unclassified Campylobacter]|uniref:putative bifunctional diguanylate cyclase/phosphodiesterase n=1 Tax=unclassified Campylobacter TaxID=2593542 RepID=UPI001BDACD52|nr:MULTISPECIES: bifunctional diguanylate cyclase/phosphodiesterase [unclassified Campylobacter]MBZ7978131.1 bifunctional diguanylate cyclase/phosphodiesterase [Campylobacter sp. RM12654]MBZ7983935.1 bifunctional diguanylate cyclase/phosphodiesterase [Campylobacter sp. RM12647]MBT0877928.1 bifunctional diguanylate cyclase/phosphodiesterase [Campylobacter sp. 2018MI01]MBT0879969.1 bifunctional diguanylate cyclase/phosphodiesterase [Campylobacter sp. 2018MI27]MBT0884124.1 bifunctional diguanylat